MADFKYSANIGINLDVKGMNNQLKDLQKQLQQISNMKIDIGTGNLTADIEKASEAAMKLSAHLATATNPQTGNLDFTKFYTSIQKSGASLEEYGKALQNMGPAGQKAFVSLADSISKAEIPLKRTSKLVDGMWDNLKKTIGWQMSSSLVHGFIGSMQQAVGYAKDLNKSLTDIRIVTGASTDQMAQFAKEANKAAKNLSTTTTDYTKASLIYYQQGLSDQEVKARTETTIKMANATGTSAQKVSDQMTAIWNNYDNGTKSLTHYADVMTALGAATASSTDEIAQGLQKFAAISDTVGLSYEYAASALATITATSRESADVVGNSLKTLFSRIQGLQLGETLDDGTTLNKYSTALAKVGISIKDSSGELKDMDLILDEMGNKWETLARDEQMALAQTVAGVRQYTQLMTLMENWDQFKQNLNIANTSGGTLDAQAAIYAESWEAASARVRTSWEGLWDNLINSDGFITALDIVSGLVGMLDGMITGLGGAGGALLTFGGALTKVFNKQITGTIQDVAYSISMMTKAGRAKVSNERSSFLSSAMEGLDRDNVSALGREYEYGARQNAIRQSLGLSYDYAKKGDKLSETQLLQYNMQKRALDELQQDSIKAASDYDQALKTRSDLYWKIADNDEIGSGLGSNSKARLEAKLKENELSIKYREDQIKNLGKGSQNKYAKKQLQKEIDETLKPAKERLTAQLKELADTNTTLTSDILSAGRNAITQNEVVNNLQSKAAKSQQIAENILADYKAKDAQEFLKRDSSNNEELKKAQNEYRRQTGMQSQYLASANRVKNSNVNEINNYSEALINQAKASNQFKMNMQQAFENNDMAAFISGLEEFKETSSNSMKGNGFLKTLTELQGKFNEDGSNIKDVISQQFGDQFLSGLEKFMASSMNKISSAVYDQLSIDDQAKFDSKEDFQQALRDAYSGVEIADTNRKQKADQAKNLTEKMQQDLDKPYQESQSGTERLVKGAAAAMEALAAGESIKALWTSLADGTATLTSTLSGIASTALNAGSAITGFQSALTGLGGISAATAGKIGLVITALTALVSTAMEIYDRATVSDKEHAQNLIDSSNELDNFTSTTKSHLETVKAQNEDYLEGVKKIKSFDQDPTTLAEDIFESNKKALNLITEYGLTEGQYSTGTNGLIEIKDNVLKQYGEQAAKQANILSEYANVFGQARVDKEQAYASSNDQTQLLTTNKTKNTQNNNWISDEQAAILDQYFEQPTYQGNGIKTYELTSEIINQMAKDGVWNDFIKTIPEVAKANLEQMKSEYDLGVSDKAQADVLYDSSLSVLSNKILQDAGYNASNTDGYLAKSGMLSNLIEQQVSQQGDWLNTDSTAALTYEQQIEAAKLIGSQLGVSNIKITGVDEAGQIKYQQGDDESTASTITKESLNSLYAMSEVMKDTNGLVSQVNEKYQDQIDAYGKAGEVVANLDTFDTALGASASAVKEFINNTTEAQSAAMTDDQGNIIKKEDGSNLTAGDVFEDSGLKEQYEHILNDDDGIVSQLELGTEVLDNVSMSTLDSLQKVMDVDQSSMEGIKGLFESITSIDNDPEKAAQLLTALSSMDFSSNAYLNASNLLSVLEDLGYNVNEGSLPAIYAWLAAITGLSPGSENLADTNSKISKNRGALNGIEPGGKVDTAKKEAAEKAGLVGDWVKTGEDEYTYNGTQNSLDAAKAFQNEAWARNQIAIDAAQDNKDKIAASGLKGDYNSITDVAKALGFGMNSSGQIIGAGGPNADLVENVLGLNPDTLLNMMNSDPQAAIDMINNMVNGSTMTEKAQATSVEDYMANIESVHDMINAINDAKARGDTGGFLLDKNTISEDAINRLDALKTMYPELAAEIESFTDNQNDMTWAQLETASAAYDAAQQFGVAYEDVRQKMEELKADPNNADVSESTLAKYAAEMIKADRAATELKQNYNSLMKDLSGANGSDAKNTALTKLAGLLRDIAKLSDNAAISTQDLTKAYQRFIKKYPDGLSKIMKGDQKAIRAFNSEVADGQVAKALGKQVDQIEDYYNTFEDDTPTTAFTEDIAAAQEVLNSMDAGQYLDQMIGDDGTVSAQAQATMSTIQSYFDGLVNSGMKAGEAMQQTATKFNVEFEPAPTWIDGATMSIDAQDMEADPGEFPEEVHYYEGATHTATQSQDGGAVTGWRVKNSPGGGTPSRGGGGGGGGGAKEPKKVAQTRRSQVVKRYKNIDAKRSINKNRRENMSKKTDKLYGEAKITNLEKENKLLEEGLKLNRKKSEEAMKNLKIDQEAVIAMSQKYGYEVKFDSEGNLENYEEILGDLYDQLHALEADNLMDESEEKVKEEIEIKKTEIEGAIEDLEDTLEQLQELNNEYEEMIDEMHENNLEKITYRLEFELELNELDTEWNDFLLEQIDDDFTQTAAAMDLVTKKITTASENIEHYKQSVTDLIELIENDPDRSLITGYLEDGVLTDEEAEILKEAYSGIIEQIEAIAEAKEEAEDRLISIFEGYNERIDLDMTSLEHYASLLEHFGNVIDIVGQKQLGLSDKFMETMSNMRIDQSRDIISVAQTNLSAMQKIKAEAEAELEKAREEGRTNDIDYWQERLDEANTAIEESRDELVAAFENSLTAIADAFDAAMERVIDTFNNTIYAFGGLEGLSADYAIMKETSDLIAADYEKIYELSKITRNINKTLSDSNIIAGKQKMLDLQKEINELQANGTEMSKYDLEYLQAKYELRLAEIELENAQNNKDTVRLSKDSEGNWSYIYTSSTDAVEEAQQKYEDALYNMQNLSYEYIDEMSEKIVSASQSMAEEIAAIDKTKFKDEVELMEEVNRIKQKYAEQLGLSEEELNKALANNNDLYNQDWQLYNQKTGYAVSSAQDWIDSYRETVLGQLTGSESDVSDYMDNFLAALDELTESIKRVASDYYFNVNETMKAAGITKDDFGNFVLSNTTAINKASENTKKNIETQTQNLVKDFNTQADKVTENQRILNDYVKENKDYLEWIKGWLEDSAEKTKDQQGKDVTYTYKEAAELFNSKYGNDYKIELTEDGKWSKTVEGVKNEILSKHNAAKSYEEKEFYADMYTWLTSYILPYTTSLDTGGYTGAWGTSGKLAMLHEKELVLNAEDTANFLDALHISRDIINSMIEMNARQSSYALGGMTPGVLQDMSQKLEQQVSIVAEFPNATDHNEIEEAFNNLINTASQYANKYNI